MGRNVTTICRSILAMAPDAHPPLRVQIGTFNYNLRGDPQGNTPKLSDWLVPTLSETDAGHATGHGPVPRSQNAAREAPDIYAVGFQELMPLHIGFCGSGKSAPFIPLARSAQEILDDTDTEIRRAIRPHAALVSNGGLYPEGGGPETYTLLARSHMVGVSLFVYGRDRSGVAERVKEIRANVVGTGLLNLLGNKGAVGIRLVLSTPSRTREEESAQDQVLTFVCAHLAAHDHNVARRQQDYANIVSRLAFSPDTVLPIPVDNPAVGSALKPADVKQPKKQYANQTSAPKERSAQALDSNTYSMYNCSHVFFFGDLNYRIGVNTRPHPKSDLPSTFTLTSAQVRDGVQNEKWSLLANYDQLSIERLSGRALQGLTELPLDWARFAPSYKYTVFEAPPMPPGTRPYKPTLQQTRQLSHKRTPGWCDRVLWRSWADGPDPSPLSGPGATRVELYRSVMGFTVRLRPLALVYSLLHSMLTLASPQSAF